MKIVTRIKGGLGNQLFCYAAARRAAVINNAELVIDHVTGFERDFEYLRKYGLDHFHIPCRKTTPSERMEPFARYRRFAAKMISRRKIFSERRYIEEDRSDFDSRLLEIRPQGTIYIDGLWQSEQYFKDIENIIREDLRIIPPEDEFNKIMYRKICGNNAVALHVRWFDVPGSTERHNISYDYYNRAIAMIDRNVVSPHYYIFSDQPQAAFDKLKLNAERVTLVTHNKGDENAYADLWLMSQCQHFITANSTFSWWAAWLSAASGKMVIHPKHIVRDKETAPWNFKSSLPNGWITL